MIPTYLLRLDSIHCTYLFHVDATLVLIIRATHKGPTAATGVRLKRSRVGVSFRNIPV